jgi:hypothetical protein
MTTNIKAKTLRTFGNPLGMPDGSLLVADNVFIDENDVITPRRGFEFYDSASSTIKQLMVYKNRLIRHVGTKLEFDSDDAGTFSEFDGDYSELISGLRIKYQEMNGNLYFTTSDGIKKISYNQKSDYADDTIFSAGAVGFSQMIVR